MRNSLFCSATGNYYTDITIEEYKKTNRTIWNETDSQAQAGTWYCVEKFLSALASDSGKTTNLWGVSW
ncbi:hypothetical protein NXW94_30200 [Bacteroides ovatus]|nr:hypothetical protein [Bacteroides ovatus]